MVRFRRSKLYGNDLRIHILHGKCGSICECMYPNLSGLNLSQKPGDILIILALCLRKLRILSHALDCLSAADLNAVRCDTGNLCRIRLTAGK